MKEKNIYKKNLNLIVIETVLTCVGASFSAPVMNLFWGLVGMDQAAVGFSQMMFTIAIVLLDIPMGYIADRLNRKVLNIIGDIGVAFAFLYYAFSKDMYMVIIAECLLGIFLAMTNGVDQSFIKYNADMIDSSGKLFKKVNSKIYTLRYIVSFAMMLVGGFISSYSLRLAIGLSLVPYFIGGIIAFFIKDYAKKITKKHNNVLKDMFLNFKEILKSKKTRTYMLAYVVGREITHPHIWIFTPLLIMVGVPIEIVSIGWIFSEIFKIVGSKISEKLVNVKTSTKFLLMFILTVFWMGVLIINTNIYTVWVFVLNGLVVGLATGSLVTPLQESAKEETQTSVMSIASTLSRLLYIPLVYFINYLGNIKLQLALVGMLIVFVPLSIYIIFKIIKLERAEKA